MIPIAEDNSTQINLSVLDNEGQNINLMFSSLSIKQKETGELVKTFPYRLYEFSDMTFPYTFPKSGTYIVTLNSKINGDPVYSKNPLVVDFDLPVRSGGLFESFRRANDILFDTCPYCNNRTCNLSKTEKEDLVIIALQYKQISLTNLDISNASGDMMQ